MLFEKPLSDLYSCYEKGDLTKRDLAGEIYQYLFDHFDQYHVFDGKRDSWNDFISWLYPRLVRAIDLYRDQGSSFDAYITGLVRAASREYRYREADHHLTEYVCWQARAGEMALCESECEYSDDRKEINIPRNIKSKHILLLLLKSYYFVSDEFVKRVSKRIGMEAEYIQDLIDKLRKLRSEHETVILDQRERLHCQHYRCLSYQKRMNAALPGTEYHRKMKGRYERARKRFHAMKRRLGHIRMSASNRMISEITGIPKGTIDTSLFAIKDHLAPYMDRSV